MNLFNFRNKSNNGASEETTKAYWEFKQKERLNLPTTKEAIDTIISVFTEDQLKALEITNNLGETLTFKKQLWALYQDYYPLDNLEEIKKLTTSFINECKLIFDNKIVVKVFLQDRISGLFTYQ